MLAALLLASAAASSTQQHDMRMMQGMTMPMPKAVKPKPAPAAKRPAKPARRAAPAPKRQAKPTQAADPHAGHAMGAMPGMDAPMSHAEHAMPGMPEHGMGTMTTSPTPMSGMSMTGTALPAGTAPPPPPPMDHYADRTFPRAAMERARRIMMAEDGAQNFYQVFFNLAEYQRRGGKDHVRWDGEGWFGGDINRLTLKTEGEGRFGRNIEAAEIQALYSRAIGPYFNLQAGVRQDLGEGTARTYAVLGTEGLAPYWFEVEGAVFLSDQGDLLGRLEGYYDQRLTQRLILQPRAEVNLSAQDMPANRIGAGLVDAELGLRLRYEVTRQFAPYVGLTWEAKAGRTADFARRDGDDAAGGGVVAGLRVWF